MENGRLIFRSVAFVLALYFFITNIILGFYILRAGSWGGGLKFLTNWNLLLNFIIACCALVNERDRKFVSYYFVLPASMLSHLPCLVSGGVSPDIVFHREGCGTSRVLRQS